MDRLSYIRQEEKAYHDYCYENYKLFVEGSWLYKPVETVMNYMSWFEEKEEIQVLDLGCGVGRNTIPLAERLENKAGQIVAVDLLDSALNKLEDYSKEYGVFERIRPIKKDIGEFKIEPHTYDYIVAVSCLEHVRSESILDRVLKEMAIGTKKNGIICMILNTDMEERKLDNGNSLDALIEVNMPTEYMLKKLRNVFKGWAELKVIIKTLEYKIVRKDEAVLLKTNALTYVVQNL